MWDYLHAHPVWGLFYLTLLCFTAAFCAVAKREPEKKPEADTEKNSEKKGPRPLMG